MRFALMGLGVLAIVLAMPGGSFANEFCDQELRPLAETRVKLDQELQRIAKDIDKPGAREEFCATLRKFIGNIRETLAYMETNQDFCQITPDVIEQAKKGLAGNEKLRRQVCVASAPQQQQPGQPAQPAIPRPPVELRLK